jgi:prolyl-tRNA editing enzyme YbaK/EbsC (Cys-tRNA(Pro) deacylase)
MNEVDHLAAQVDTTLQLGGDASTAMKALKKRQEDILTRIEALERRLNSSSPPAAKPAAATPAAAAPAPAAATFSDDDASAVQRRLHNELITKSIVNHRFVRAPPEYYDSPLEFRQAVLDAASIHHLCKSIIMENTRIEEDPGIQKYFLVMVQYSARLHSDKLRAAVQAFHAARGVKLSRARVNMRLCAEEVSDRLSGFEHNAVSPVGMATALPMIMSHRIVALEPDFFWLGAGEVDLKVGMSANEFNEAYKPIVADVTYDD